MHSVEAADGNPINGTVHTFIISDSTMSPNGSSDRPVAGCVLREHG